MKAYINDHHKVAYVLTDDVALACRIGLWFAHDNMDLMGVGWVVLCLPVGKPLNRADRREANVDGAYTLAKAIREGPGCPHSCPQHPKREATG